MTFTEAFIQAANGKKITRQEWGEGWVALEDNKTGNSIIGKYLKETILK